MWLKDGERVYHDERDYEPDYERERDRARRDRVATATTTTTHSDIATTTATTHSNPNTNTTFDRDRIPSIPGSANTVSASPRMGSDHRFSLGFNMEGRAGKTSSSNYEREQEGRVADMEAGNTSRMMRRDDKIGRVGQNDNHQHPISAPIATFGRERDRDSTAVRPTSAATASSFARNINMNSGTGSGSGSAALTSPSALTSAPGSFSIQATPSSSSTSLSKRISPPTTSTGSPPSTSTSTSATVAEPTQRPTRLDYTHIPDTDEKSLIRAMQYYYYREKGPEAMNEVRSFSFLIFLLSLPCPFRSPSLLYYTLLFSVDCSLIGRIFIPS